MSSYWDRLEVRDPRILEREGADEALVYLTLYLRARGSGKEWVTPMVQVVKVEREREWILSIRAFYWDVRGLNEVSGLN